MAQGTGSATVKILHIAVEVLTIITLTAVAALAAILVTWATARIIRRRRQAHRQATLHSVTSDAQPHVAQAGSTHRCPACSGTGTDLSVIGGRSYQDQSCPAGQPAHRAG